MASVRHRTALIAALGIAVGGCGARSDSQVASDLSTLLGKKNVEIALPSEITCAHQNGNQYLCIVHPASGGSSQTMEVTDDGHAITATGAP